jgi:polyhydroxyalkanoate synthesis regulator phasin
MRLTLLFDEEQEMVNKSEEILGIRHVIFAPTLSSTLKTTIITLTLSLKKIAPREI